MKKVKIDDFIKNLKPASITGTTREKRRRPMSPKQLKGQKVVGEIRFAKRLPPPGPYHPELQEYK